MSLWWLGDWVGVFPTPARGNANGINEFTKQEEKGGWYFFPTPARGNANGISEFTKQKEKRGCYVPGAYAPGTLVFF